MNNKYKLVMKDCHEDFWVRVGVVGNPNLTKVFMSNASEPKTYDLNFLNNLDSSEKIRCEYMGSTRRGGRNVRTGPESAVVNYGKSLDLNFCSLLTG